jgi:hypothetical protein
VDISQRIRSVRPERSENWPQLLWRASALHQCYRQQILGARRITTEISPQLARLFALHSAAHDVAQEMIMAEFGGSSMEKDFVDDELRVSGHCDNFLPNKRVVIEVKTLNDFYARSIVANPQKAYWRHQLNLYLYAAKQEFGEEFTGYTAVVQFNGKIDVLEHDYDEEFLTRLNILNSCWDANIMPPPCWECDGDKSDCPIHHICTEPIDTIDEFVKAVKEDADGDAG